MSLTRFCAKQMPKICKTTVASNKRVEGEAEIECIGPHLEQRDPDEDASDHRQVVLKPLLELRNAAFHVDVRALLRVLVEPTSSG